jgi:hypothetical protein
VSVKITVTRNDRTESFVVPHTEWRSAVARYEADPEVRQVTARQVEPIVQYAYNRAA